MTLGGFLVLNSEAVFRNHKKYGFPGARSDLYHTAGILHSIVASLLQTYKVNKYGRSGKFVLCGLGFVHVGPVPSQSFCHALMLSTT